MSRTQAHFSLARAVFASDLSGDLARDLALITQRENTDGNDENKNTLADFIEPIAKQAKQTKNTKAQIIDIRSSQDFAKKHIKGAKISQILRVYPVRFYLAKIQIFCFIVIRATQLQ